MLLFPAASGAGTKLKPWGDIVILTVHWLRKTGLQCIVTPYNRYQIAIHHHLCNVIVTTVAIAITTHTVLYKAICCSSTATVPRSTFSPSAMGEEMKPVEDVFEAEEPAPLAQDDNQAAAAVPVPESAPASEEDAEEAAAENGMDIDPLDVIIGQNQNEIELHSLPSETPEDEDALEDDTEEAAERVAARAAEEEALMRYEARAAEEDAEEDVEEEDEEYDAEDAAEEEVVEEDAEGVAEEEVEAREVEVVEEDTEEAVPLLNDWTSVIEKLRHGDVLWLMTRGGNPSMGYTIDYNTDRGEVARWVHALIQR